MLTRCPGCGKEIDESLDVCPHCKRDFSVQVRGTGRRVGPAGDQPNAPPQAKAPPPRPQPKATPPQQKRPPAPAPKPAPRQAPPPADDLPAHMKADIGPSPSDEFLSPEDVQAAAASEDDLPAFMKAELDAPPAGGSDLPPHMMADISSPPGQDMDDSVLPPHMRGDALDSFTPRAPVEEKSNPLLYVGIGAVFVAGFVISRVMGGKPAPAPEPVREEAEAPALPDPSVEMPDEDSAEAAKTEEEAAKAAEKAEEAKKDLPKLDLNAPPIADSPPPPIEEAPAASRARRPRKQTQAPAPIPVQEDIASKPRAPKHAKWRLRAKLINLLTLEPVADAEVSLYDNQTGQRFPTATGPDGGFRKTLPANIPGYKVLFRHKDYETKYLPGDAHDFASMSEEERQEVGTKLKQFTPEAKALVGDGDGMIKTEFYLLPREKHGMSLEEALDR